MPIPTSEQIDAYVAAPTSIAAAIEGLDERHMQYIGGENEWSIHEVIVHLPDSEVFAFERIRQTLVEDKPTIQAYNEDTWAKKLAYRTQDWRLALALFTALRRSSSALLRTLPPEAWARTCFHPERGEMSLYDIFNLYLDHGRVHQEQIERLKLLLRQEAE